MKRVFAVLFVLVFTGFAFANGVSLNSPGTRSIAMGGAYIAHVNDYSAPYWNPAGLMNLDGAQASFFLTDLIPMASYERSAYGIDAKAATNHYLAPNFSGIWTCKLYDKVHLGLSMIVPAGLGVEWDGADYLPFAGPVSITHPLLGTVSNPFVGTEFEWESKIAVMNFALSAAYRFGDKLNTGIALNYAYGTMLMKRGVDVMTFLTPGGVPTGGEDTMLDSQYEEESSGSGFGVGLGVQYMLNEKITLGASLRTPITVGFSGDATVKNSLAGTVADFSFDRDVTWPLWVGGGVAFKPMDKLLVAFDLQWSQWSESEDYLIAESDAGKDTLTLLWEDCMQIRFGGEYQMNDKLALRLGFYLDPAPGIPETQTILIPQSDYTVITLGAGYKVNEKITCDFAFEYLSGSEVEVTSTDAAEHGVAMEGIHNINIMVPSFAFTYKFK